MGWWLLLTSGSWVLGKILLEGRGATPGTGCNGQDGGRPEGGWGTGSACGPTTFPASFSPFTHGLDHMTYWRCVHSLPQPSQLCSPCPHVVLHAASQAAHLLLFQEYGQ